MGVGRGKGTRVGMWTVLLHMVFPFRESTLGLYIATAHLVSSTVTGQF